MSTTTINPAMLSKVIKAPPRQPSQPAARGASGITTVTIHPSAKLQRLPSQPFWPDPFKSTNQGFGYNPETGKFHPGWDITAPMNTPVFAPVTGKVLSTKAMDPWGWGNSIEILTPDGYHLYFAHLSSFDVQPGQEVVGGQQIGLSGNTFTSGVGFSSGPHLHFEVRTGTLPDTAIDPQKFFSAEDVSTAMPAYGTTFTMGGIADAMGATTELYANSGGRGAQPKLDAPHVPTTIPQGPSASTAAPAAVAQTTSKPNLATESTGTAGTQASGATVWASWNLMDSPVLGKITLKLTPSNVALVLGSILVIVGLVGITWKPIVKPTVEESARVAGVAAKAAVAG